jgi:hypothetical protein
LNLIVAIVGAHTGACSRYDLPVSHIDQDAFNKGPFLTKSRFNRMNRAELIPKYAVAIFTLGNHWLAAGYLTVIPYKPFAIQAQISANIDNLRFGQVGAAIPFTAVPTTLAAE